MSRRRMQHRRSIAPAPPESRKGGALESAIARLSSPWAPVLFFALLTTVYFSGFIFSNDVILGSDTGTEFHKGKEPFLEKLARVPPANWSRNMGGTAESSALRAQYFPLYIVALLTGEHRYFGWRYVAGMFCAGTFTFLFVRGLGLHPLTALLTGVAYASAPAILTFTFAGQFAKMSAMTLFPLMAWGLYRGLETRRWVYFLATAGGIGAAVYTPQIQIVYFSLWGLGLIFLVQGIALHLQERDLRASLHRSLLAAAAVCLGLAIGAEGVFPQWYNNRNTKRAAEVREEGGLEHAASWSLHPEEMASLIVPEFGHFDLPPQGRRYWGRNPFKLNSEYFGIVVLFFAVLALGRIRKDPRVLLFSLLFLLAAAFSLGPHTPLHQTFYNYVPGVRSLRVPGMIAFLFAFAACGLAALGMDPLFSGNRPHHPRLGVGTAAALFLLLLLFIFPKAILDLWIHLFWSDIPPDKLQIAQSNLPHLKQGALLAALIVAVLSALTWKRLQDRLSAPTFVLILLPILLFDTWRIDKQFLRYENPDRTLPRERINANAVRFLKQDPDLYRVLSIPPARQSPLYGTDQVYGFNDFALPRYESILDSRPFLMATRIPLPQNAEYILNFLPIFNLMNTRYIVSPKPLPLKDIPEAARLDGLHIYKNPGALPWFYLASRYAVETDPERILSALTNPEFNPARIAILEEEPPLHFEGEKGEAGEIDRLAYDPRAGRIELQTRAPGPRILVVSENYHPFWHAFVDGDEQPLLRANYLWKAVAVPPGEHRVEFRYRDPAVALCRTITLAATGLLIVGIAAGFRWGRQREKESENA